MKMIRNAETQMKYHYEQNFRLGIRPSLQFPLHKRPPPPQFFPRYALDEMQIVM